MSQSLRILIVEDEPMWAKSIKSNLLEILNDLGLPCTIDTPESIQECKMAIMMAGESPYDLITLDINYRDDSADEPTDGLKLLGIIGRCQSAWLVSILTGVEADVTVEDTYGSVRARQLQEELRSRAYTSFPPERLLVLEKPALEEEARLANRLRQVCLILQQSMVRRNLFRPMKLSCLVASHRTIKGDLIKRDSKEFRRAKEAMEFVRAYENDPVKLEQFKKERKIFNDADTQKEYKKELKLDILAKNGKKLPNADWVDDVVSLRQVRFGCGEVITLPDGPNFDTIAWLLRHPGKQFDAHQIGGEVAEAGRLSEDFQNAASDDDEGDGPEFDDLEEDDDFASNQDRRGKDRDYESDTFSGEAPPDWDPTQAMSHAAYKQELRSKLAKLETASERNRQVLQSEIDALRNELGKVRRKAVGGKTHGSIKQHKSRAIGALKEAGQVELANHLEMTIRIEDGKFWYHVEPGTIFWNVD